MQKISPPNGVYIITVVSMIVGVFLVQGGGARIYNPFRQASTPLDFAGLAFLLVGIVDITAAVGFFAAKPWSWSLGLASSILTAFISVVVVVVGGQSFSSIVDAFPPYIASVICPLIIAYYLTRSSVKTYLLFAKNVKD